MQSHTLKTSPPAKTAWTPVYGDRVVLAFSSCVSDSVTAQNEPWAVKSKTLLLSSRGRLLISSKFKLDNKWGELIIQVSHRDKHQNHWTAVQKGTISFFFTTHLCSKDPSMFWELKGSKYPHRSPKHSMSHVPTAYISNCLVLRGTFVDPYTISRGTVLHNESLELPPRSTSVIIQRNRAPKRVLSYQQQGCPFQQPQCPG